MSGSRAAVFWIGLVCIVVGVVLVIGNREFDDEPFGPNSTSPDGALGLVRLLDRFGTVDVVADAPAGQATAILLREAPNADTTPIRDWVANGGTLVVADPLSELSPVGTTGGGEPTTIGSGDCPFDVVDRVDAVTFEFGDRVFADEIGCFGNGSARLIRRTLGDGEIYFIVDQSPFLNAFLAESDNAVLAVDLLMSSSDTVAFIETRPVVASGDRSLWDLVPTSTKSGIWLLLGSVVAFGLYRARRIGAPVLESQLVEIPGSELVRATGNLLERTAATNDAALLLREAARRDAARAVGLSPDVSPMHLAAIVSAQSGLHEELVLAMFIDTDTTELQLVSLTENAAELRGALHQSFDGLRRSAATHETTPMEDL